MQMDWPAIESFTTGIVQTVLPVLAGAGILMAVALSFLGKVREGLLSLVAMLGGCMALRLLSSFLPAPAPSAVLPPLRFWRDQAGSVGSVAAGLIGAALIVWAAVRQQQKRRARQQREQERAGELTLRAEYEAWLDDEVLKLEIEALSKSAHSAVWPLLTRLRQCRADNLQCLGSATAEPVRTEPVVREWNELRAALGVFRGELAQAGRNAPGLSAPFPHTYVK